MNPRASRSSFRALCSLCLALGSLGALVLGGCATAPIASPPASPPASLLSVVAPPAPATPATAGLCVDAADCRAALRALPREPTEECEVRERAALARRACDRDVAEGCTDLGRWRARGTVEGEGGPDLPAAAALFERGCALGDGEGCAWRALMTLHGQGEPRDVVAGRAGLQAACDQRPGVACGLAVEGLVEAAQREDQAPEWEWLALFMHRGCDAGDGLSCRLLGDAFSAGRGVEADPDRALALYARACEAGNGGACANQELLLRAEGVGDVARTEPLLSRGCELGSSEACRLWVLETLRTRGEGLDEAGRRGRYRQACDRGAAVGCLALYDELRQETPALLPPFELPGLLKRACQLGEKRACAFLDEVSEKAEPLCESGSASACGVLGVLRLSPPRWTGEEREGERLLHGACEAGDASSCKWLGDLSQAMVSGSAQCPSAHP